MVAVMLVEGSCVVVVDNTQDSTPFSGNATLATTKGDPKAAL
jgi:hypothetical protein